MNLSGERERRIRVTVDLTRDQHRFLRRYAFDADADATAVLRILLRLLQDDADLAKQVRAQLQPKYPD